MQIPHQLSLVIRESHSLAEILESAVRIVAREMRMDVCSIYLLDWEDQQLHLTATEGLEKSAVGKVTLALGEGLTGRVVGEMRALAVEDASAHPGYRYFPETKEERFRSYLGVPMVLHNRPIGAVVVQTKRERSYSDYDIQTLNAIAAQLVGVVVNARIIEALDRGEEGTHYLNEVREWHRPLRPLRTPTRDGHELHGIAVSSGVAMGEAVIRGSLDQGLEAETETFQGVEAEKARVHEALERTRSYILEIQKAAAAEADEEHALIFTSHLLLLNDPVLADKIDGAIRGGDSAPVAVSRALEEFCERLTKVSDPYLQERIEDIKDLRSRIMGNLLASGAYSPHLRDRVVVSRGLPPSLVVELKAEGARGLITEAGGATSHGALLARSMGVPAVTGVPRVLSLIRDGDQVIVDGTSGKVVVHPTTAHLEQYEELQARQAQRESEDAKYREVPLQSSDGIRTTLLANIGVAADLVIAGANGAEGVGLYRTEFPFVIRGNFPTLREQVRIYRKAYDVFPEGPVNFRILDLGADKFLSQSRVQGERNPFRGYRSIRVLFDFPSVLREQVQAFALAASGRPLSILIPMVSSLEDLRHTRELITEALHELSSATGCPIPQIGVMVELPAAVEIAGELAEEADYISIGTNDLIQYALAVDREDSRLSSASDPFHPAVLRMVERTIRRVHEKGKPVSVCGEMASKPALAACLMAMGIDALSVAPTALPGLKRAVATMEIEPLRTSVGEVLGAPDARSMRSRLRHLLSAEAVGDEG